MTSFQTIPDLLAEHPDIDGIFAGNDIMAVGIIKALAKLDIKIPEQIKVIGFDGIEWGTTITPELTTMEQPTVKKSPIEIVKRTAVPMLVGVVFMFILSMIVFL